MKKMNYKGFSLIEILATIAIIGILAGLSIMGYSRIVSNSRMKAYEVMAASVQTAMDNYTLDHPNVKEMTFEELVEAGYLSNPIDPSSKDQYCRGKIKITENADATLNYQTEGLEKNEYKVSMCCIDYNYTYESNGVKHPDRFCKVDPYNIEDIENIKVLNIYPKEAYANYVKNWMNEYGKDSTGKQIIHVTPVFISTFNENPSYYLGSVGHWNYDVIVFGFADSYCDIDLTASSAEVVRRYLSTGGAAIFGHDTIIARHTYFNSLRGFVNMDTTGDTSWAGRTQLTIQREGVFTQYPYKIGSVGSGLTISTSHVYGQIAHGDVWITFNDIGTPEKSVYLSTYGNNAFIQTGHTNGSATVEEKKIIANIIFYMVAQQYLDD